MKAKTLTLLSLSILASLVLISFASAVSIVNVGNNDASVYNGNSITISFQVQSTAGESDFSSLNYNTVTLTSGSNTFTGTVTNPVSTLENGTTSATMSLTFSVPDSQAIGTYSGTLNVLNGSSVLASQSIGVTVKSDNPDEIQSCDLTGNPNDDLRVRRIDVTNNGMKVGDTNIRFGDDNSWYPLDNIELKLEIDNHGNDHIDNIEVDWGLWDTDTGDWAIEPRSEKDFDLSHGNSKTLTVDFNLEKELDIDMQDLTDGDHYRLYVYATGTDRETDNDVCASDFKDIGVVIESDFVVLTNFQYTENVSCGESVPISADVWNIGDSDEDNVYVHVYNTELGIDKTVNIGDISSLNRESLDTIVNIPDNAGEKLYGLTFDVYDDNGDIFETGNNDLARFNLILDVGSCRTQAKAIVSASLESGGAAGQPLVVKATVVNSGDSTATYNLNLAGFAAWANSGTLDTNSVTLNKGEQKDVTATFNVKDDVSGDQSFNIEVLSQGDMVLTQPVTVTVTPAKTGLFSGLGSSTGGNGYIWIIGILNVILVVIIIIVAIRVARK